jgi:DNA-binding NarL/FixJ family response regulator
LSVRGFGRIFPVAMTKDDATTDLGADESVPVRRNERGPAVDGRRRGGPVRVLLADEGPEFAAEAIGLFKELDAAELVGVATSADQAERYVARLAPDLVLLSLTLPDANGLEAVRRIGRLHPVPIAVLALHETEICRAAVLRAGACDVIAKDELVTRLPAALKRLFGGSPSHSSRGTRRDPGRRKP